MIGYLEVLGAVSIWAFFNGILVNGIKTSGTGVGAWTGLVGMLISALVFLVVGVPSAGLSVTAIIFLSLLGISAGLNNGCYYTAIKISVTNAPVFHYLAPLLVIGWYFVPIFSQPILWFDVLAVVGGFIGIAWVVIPNFKEGNRRLIYLGFGSAFFYSLEIVLSGYISKELHIAEEISAFWKLLFQFLVMPIFAAFLGESIRVNKKERWKVILGGVLLYISFILYFAGSATVSDLHRGVLGYIDRIGALLLGAWWFRKPLTKNILIGAVIILGAGLLIVFK